MQVKIIALSFINFTFGLLWPDFSNTSENRTHIQDAGFVRAALKGSAFLSEDCELSLYFR